MTETNPVRLRKKRSPQQLFASLDPRDPGDPGYPRIHNVPSKLVVGSEHETPAERHIYISDYRTQSEKDNACFFMVYSLNKMVLPMKSPFLFELHWSCYTRPDRYPWPPGSSAGCRCNQSLEIASVRNTEGDWSVDFTMEKNMWIWHVCYKKYVLRCLNHWILLNSVWGSLFHWQTPTCAFTTCRRCKYQWSFRIWQRQLVPQS